MFRLRHVEDADLDLRCGCLVLALLLLGDLLTRSALLNIHGWAWTLLIAPLLIFMGILQSLVVHFLDIDTCNKRYVFVEGFRFWTCRNSGDIRDLGFVCVQQFERWETRYAGASKVCRYVASKNPQRVVGAKADIGLPKGHNRRFVFTQFSRDVPRDGSYADVFPWDLYGAMLDEVRVFAQTIDLEFKRTEEGEAAERPEENAC
jgi:hypothetical protein